MSEYSQEQIMLSLSLLSYRGFWDPGMENQQGLASEIENGLEQLEPLKKQWKLVWGPGTYRYLGSIFDSSMMYVVQHKIHCSRFAIVVRGTNPVALFDWLFGDFLSHKQVPWHYDDSAVATDAAVAPDAKVSLSTALGLKILLNMRSEIDPDQIDVSGNFDFLFDLASKAVSTAQEAGNSAISAAQNLAKTATEVSRYKSARRLSRNLLRYQNFWTRVVNTTDDMTSSATDLLFVNNAMRMLSIRQHLIKTFDSTLGSLPETPVAMLMPQASELHADQQQGMGLLELLGNLAEKHGDDLEIFVTGHSKGGALAPALALFLSDTQNNEEISIPDHYQWNRHGRASIHCYSFASPTPGNAAFAKYFNQQLGKTFYRYSNTLDLVTHAWRSDQLRNIANIYNGSANPMPGLELIAKMIADETENLDYCHLGQDYQVRKLFRKRIEKHVFEFHGPLQENINSYMLQELYQHVEAYIAELGLEGVIEIKDLLGDLKIRL